MRYTKKDFDTDFPNDDACLERLFQDRYGDVTICPRCGVEDTKFYRVKKRKCYACMHCGYQLHPLSGTIFHKSTTPLRSWFYAIYLFSVSKNGVAAKELERHLGVTYKTAHRMARQIRLLMSEDTPVGGSGKPVEVDETYIGGKHPYRIGRTKKSVVFGAVERDGRVIASHVKSSGARVLIPKLHESVTTGSTIFSDELIAYKRLNSDGYNHASVNHSKLEWVRGTVHTNTIESYWSQLKRSIRGTYNAVSPKYLQLYLGEFSYRYNRRHSNTPIFIDMIERTTI